ncbi:hypothetical protein I6L25_09505 [Acinetobacter nosocomialis]|uniref:hypothetical protein n=1 Tax=Acinetobacter nosocomialis TaxID=106654 RepID=UPI0002CF6DFF|nr:hypothetical protein [Acinetobacter nosocomialis]ENU47276.1 hypothetical protein F984_01645 [Acinetobacter nosocomialis NIPH 2119]QXC10672.1 hypothetical protein I6L25_09505 [Acinetobacter nosocomialis]
MQKYLAVAEKVYKNIKKDSLFTDDIIQNLNCLISQIRKAIKGTELKLKFNYIDFDEHLTKPLSECKVKIDLSVMPKFANEGEYLLWLVGFIERITEGGKSKFPPISQLIPPEFKMAKESTPIITAPPKEEHADLIISYFKSEDFIKNQKRYS